MLETLRSWLNGKRDYFTGVVLFAQMGNDQRLLELFKKRQTDYTNARLQEELLIVCNNLKNKDAENSDRSHLERVAESDANLNGDCGQRKNFVTKKFDGLFNLEGDGSTKKRATNPELYRACKIKADKIYKEAMNARAVLFSLAQSDDYYQPNLPHKLAERSPIAIEVIQNYILASKLYDDASFVMENGHLPFQEGQENPMDEYSSLPDSLVKQALDNLRKNINKIKKREGTPDRVQLLQRHELNLLKLEERWRLLRP